MRVTPNLDTLSSVEICNPADEGLIQTYPAACFDGQNYMVVWSDEKFGQYYVAAARVTPGGAVLDTGECITSGSGSYEYRAKIVYDGNRCLVVWPKSSIIYGRFLNSSCQTEGSIFTIGSGGAGGPNIAFDGRNYLVVYQAGSWPNYNIYGQRVSPQGTLVGSQITIAIDNGDTLRWPDVVFDGRNYLVVWMSGQNNPGPNYIYGQGVAPDGSLIGNNFQICDNTPSMRWWPVVAASDRNYLVAWGQGSSSNVYGNVDIGLMGIKEDVITEQVSKSHIDATILRGSLSQLREKGYNVFDITGRQVEYGLKPGVYFLEKDGQVVEKVIKVK